MIRTAISSNLKKLHIASKVFDTKFHLWQNTHKIRGKLTQTLGFWEVWNWIRANLAAIETILSQKCIK
jgi:hypothetical protein